MCLVEVVPDISLKALLELCLTTILLTTFLPRLPSKIEHRVAPTVEPRILTGFNDLTNRIVLPFSTSQIPISLKARYSPCEPVYTVDTKEVCRRLYTLGSSKDGFVPKL